MSRKRTNIKSTLLCSQFRCQSLSLQHKICQTYYYKSRCVWKRKQIAFFLLSTKRSRASVVGGCRYFDWLGLVSWLTKKKQTVYVTIICDVTLTDQEYWKCDPGAYAVAEHSWTRQRTRRHTAALADDRLCRRPEIGRYIKEKNWICLKIF